MRHQIKITTAIGLLLLACAANASSFTFTHAGNQLHGLYLLPTVETSKGLIVFVHGDGASNADANGFYPLFWQSLRAQGYHVASWNKPGVGDSTGNWLRQTMQDRQSELIAGVQHLQQVLAISPSDTGVLAFSQGGWVAPAIADSAEHIGFLIGIGFARNWIEQGRYYNRLTGDEEEYLADIALLTQQHEDNQIPEEDRRWFVFFNFMADASDDYQNIAVPTLLLWGEDDQNVNADAQMTYWRNHPNPNVEAKLLAQATHQLLDSDKFRNRQLGMWDWLKFQWQGQNALAPAALPTIEGFLRRL